MRHDGQARPRVRGQYLYLVRGVVRSPCQTGFRMELSMVREVQYRCLGLQRGPQPFWPVGCWLSIKVVLHARQGVRLIKIPHYYSYLKLILLMFLARLVLTVCIRKGTVVHWPDCR